MRYAAILFVVVAASFVVSAQDQVGKGTTGTIPAIGSPSTFSEASNLSGCLVEGNGRFWLTGSGNAGLYALEAGDLSGHVHHVVRVAGYPASRPVDHHMAFHVNTIADTGEFCNPEANEQLPAVAVTGKAGNEGDVITETSTHINQETAGVETQAGIAEARGQSPHVNPQLSIYERPGSPPNWEQVGESRGAATDLAASAEQTEVGAPQGTYGVGATRPNYQNPAATQEIGGASSPMQHGITANMGAVSPNSAPQRLQGCVSQADGQWQLSAGGKTYALQGNTANLKGWAGHTVAVTGRTVGESAFQVSGIRHVSSTCP